MGQARNNVLQKPMAKQVWHFHVKQSHVKPTNVKQQVPCAMGIGLEYIQYEDNQTADPTVDEQITLCL